MATRRRYADDVRRRAIDMIITGGRTAASVSRDLGIAAGTLRHWVRDRRARAWADNVAVHFGYLERHGFRVTERDASSWARTVVYRRPPAAVLVSEDREYWCVEVRLVRAPDGVPLAQGWMPADRRFTSAYAAS